MGKRSKSGATHTSVLQFDLTKMKSQIAEIDAIVAEAARKANKTWKDNLNLEFKVNVSNKQGAVDNTSEIQAEGRSLDELMAKYSTYSRATVSFSGDFNEEVKASIHYMDKFGHECVANIGKVKDGWAVTSSSITDNVEKQRKEFDSTSKTISTLNERFSSLDKTLRGAKFADDKSGAVDNLRNKISDLRKELDGISASASKNGFFSSEQKQRVEEIKAELSKCKTEYNDLSKSIGSATKEGGNFFKIFAEKAKWLAAYGGVMLLSKGIKDLFSTIKTTEDATVELQRVINDSTVTNSEVSSKLYDIASEFGRTFEETSEVALRFVQAGQEWDDAIELTRGTMLALNTAELDVTQSTSGLIAVMAQWGLEADQYSGVIDKINITADNFAVTSESIVDALQRSGGTAKAYGMTLEELIATITVLSEATGRSGKVLGTAINSLIAYTTKAKSLDLFESLGVEVYDNMTGNMLPVIEIWEQLADRIDNVDDSLLDVITNDQTFISEFLNSDMAEATGMLDEYNQLVEEAKVSGKEVQEIYSAAGTFRRNFFIALLGNFSKISDVLNNMSDAEGYSVQENEKYMESLTAMYNQLKVSLAELAVQAGEAGLLDLFKTVVKAATAVAKFTKDIGGLVTILGVLAGAILIVKQQKIAATFADWGESIRSAIDSVKKFNAAIKGVMHGTMSLNEAIASMSDSWGSVTAVVLAAVSAITMAVGAIKNANEEAKRLAFEQAESNLSHAKSLEELRKKYIDAFDNIEDETERTEKLNEIVKELIETYNVEKSALEGVTESRSAGIGAIDAEIEKRTNEAVAAVAGYQDEVIRTMENLSGFTDVGQSEIFISPTERSVELLEKYGYELESSSRAQGKVTSVYKTSSESIYEQRDALAALISDLSAFGENTDSEETLLADLIIAYEHVNKIIEENGAQYDQIIGAHTDYFKVKYKEQLANIDSEETYNELRNAAIAYANEIGSDGLSDVLLNLIDEVWKLGYAGSEAAEGFEGLADSAIYTTDAVSFAVDEYAKSIETINGEIDKAQSSFGVLKDAVNNYNMTGTLSIDMLQQLIALEPEYLAALDWEGNSLSLNEQATGDLINAKRGLLDALVQEQLASNLAAITQKYQAETQELAGNAADVAEDQTYNYANACTALAQDALSGATSVSLLNESILSLAQGAGIAESLQQDFINDVNSAISMSQNLSNAIQNASLDLGQWSTSSREGASATREATSALKDQMTALKAQQNQIKENAKAEIEALKKQKEAIEAEAKSKIDALNKVKEARERNEKYEDYLKNKREAEKDLTKAQSRSGIEWREAEEEARQKIVDLDDDWRKQLEDWDIEDKIDAINKWKDAQIEAIDAQIESIESARDQQVSALQSQIDALQEQISSASSSAAGGMGRAFGNAINGIKQEANAAIDEVRSNFQDTRGEQLADEHEAKFAVQETAEEVKKTSDSFREMRGEQLAAEHEAKTANSEIWKQSLDELLQNATDSHNAVAQTAAQTSIDISETLTGNLEQAYDRISAEGVTTFQRLSQDGTTFFIIPFVTTFAKSFIDMCGQLGIETPTGISYNIQGAAGNNITTNNTSNRTANTNVTINNANGGADAIRRALDITTKI